MLIRKHYFMFYIFAMSYNKRYARSEDNQNSIIKLNLLREATLVKDTIYTCRLRRNTRDAISSIKQKYEKSIN